jgi:hypothetical protein
MRNLKKNANDIKRFFNNLLKADTATLNFAGLALGNYLLRIMKYLLRQQAKKSRSLILGTLLALGYTDAYKVFLTSLPALLMLALCVLYFTYAPSKIFNTPAIS